MGIKPTFVMADLHAYLDREANKLHDKIIQVFMRLGEKSLAECRSNKTYQDDTGNLTASMGYVITYNGQVIQNTGFEKQGGTSSGASGKAEGKSLAMELATQHRTGYALIVVAGMDYAYAVESKGYNVLTSAKQLAESELPKLLTMLKLK